METSRRIKGPALEFCKFLWFIGIQLLITENHATDRTEYFSETSIYLFGGCSIGVNQFMSGNWFESICYALNHR